MTDHAAAPAADIDRDDRPTAGPRPGNGGAPAPRLLMVGAADAPSCEGDGCVVPFAASLPTRTKADSKADTDTDTEGSPR